VQQAIHRIQPYEQTRDLIAVARELGFDSINVDLIYGLPYQTAESFAHTVEQIVSLSPDRIAMFSYAHVPWLKKQQGSFAAHLPEGMKKFDIFPQRLAEIPGSGVSLHRHGPLRQGKRRNWPFSQSNRTLHRNFQGLHHQSGARIFTVWASRPSAASRKTYAQNHRDLPSWEKGRCRERGIATMRGYRLSQDDIIRREVISRLLCHTVIVKDEISKKFGRSFRRILRSRTRTPENAARGWPCDNQRQGNPRRVAGAAFLSATWR